MKKKIGMYMSYLSLFSINEYKLKMNYFFKSSDFKWLDKNKMERMDALVEDDNYTAKMRRDFHLDRYKFAADFVRGMDVMDIACGTGYGTRIILELGQAKKCIGIDIDEDAVLYAQKNHKVLGSQFIASAAENVSIESDFADVIVSFETIEHVQDEHLLISEFHRLLKKGGLLIISTPNKWPLAIAPYHTKEYDLEEFKKVLNSKFEIEYVYNQNSGTPWEYNHNQETGIVITTKENEDLAECYIAICKKV